MQPAARKGSLPPEFFKRTDEEGSTTTMANNDQPKPNARKGSLPEDFFRQPDGEETTSTTKRTTVVMNERKPIKTTLTSTPLMATEPSVAIQSTATTTTTSVATTTETHLEQTTVHFDPRELSLTTEDQVTTTSNSSLDIFTAKHSEATLDYGRTEPETWSNESNRDGKNSTDEFKITTAIVESSSSSGQTDIIADDGRETSDHRTREPENTLGESTAYETLKESNVPAIIFEKQEPSVTVMATIESSKPDEIENANIESTSLLEDASSWSTVSQTDGTPSEVNEITTQSDRYSSTWFMKQMQFDKHSNQFEHAFSEIFPLSQSRTSAPWLKQDRTTENHSGETYFVTEIIPSEQYTTLENDANNSSSMAVDEEESSRNEKTSDAIDYLSTSATAANLLGNANAVTFNEESVLDSQSGFSRTPTTSFEKAFNQSENLTNESTTRSENQINNNDNGVWPTAGRNSSEMTDSSENVAQQLLITTQETITDAIISMAEETRYSTIVTSNVNHNDENAITENTLKPTTKSARETDQEATITTPSIYSTTEASPEMTLIMDSHGDTLSVSLLESTQVVSLTEEANKTPETVSGQYYTTLEMNLETTTTANTTLRFRENEMQLTELMLQTTTESHLMSTEEKTLHSASPPPVKITPKKMEFVETTPQMENTLKSSTENSVQQTSTSVIIIDTLTVESTEENAIRNTEITSESNSTIHVQLSGKETFELAATTIDQSKRDGIEQNDSTTSANRDTSLLPVKESGDAAVNLEHVIENKALENLGDDQWKLNSFLNLNIQEEGGEKIEYYD